MLKLESLLESSKKDRRQSLLQQDIAIPYPGDINPEFSKFFEKYILDTRRVSNEILADRSSLIYRELNIVERSADAEKRKRPKLFRVKHGRVTSTPREWNGAIEVHTHARARARRRRGEKEEKRREETVEDGGAGNYARTEYSQLRGCCTAQKSVI